MAMSDEEPADAVARATKVVDSSLIFFAPHNSVLARAGEANGCKIASQVVADRNYLSHGSLVPRKRPDALLNDPALAASRVLRMLREGKVRSIDGEDVDLRAETICVHGDNPAAVEFARSLRASLEKEGVQICAPSTGA